MRRASALALLLVHGSLFVAHEVWAQTVNVSGGVDARLEAPEGDESSAVLEGLFLNARRVFRDDLGDRWIVVAQADADHNLEHVRPYQLYAQYKGPLGHWNIRAGHYLLPFGLLAGYDTERLVLNAIEEENLGIKLDTGVEALGYHGGWDWAISASRGAGRRWPEDADGSYAVVARLARGGDALNAGASALLGTIRTVEPFPSEAPSTRERKMALDVTWQQERWTVRSEVSGGTENGKDMTAAVMLASYAMGRWWDLDAKYAMLSRSATIHTGGAGASLRLGRGWVLRPTGIIEFTPEDTNYGFIVQLYYDFSTTR